MQKIKKYKYLLILLSFVISLIFINFFNDGKIRRDITSGFIELFSISNIEIIGRDRSSKNTLSSLLKPYENQSLVTLNLKNIQHEIEKITWVKDVTVRRVYPQTLSISIEEYFPSAVWKRGSEQYILDEYGYRIEKIKSNEFQNYFQIKGMGADKKLKNLLDKLVNYPDIFNQIDHANFVSRRRWDLHYKNGVRILLPENNISESLSLLVKLFAFCMSIIKILDSCIVN